MTGNVVIAEDVTQDVFMELIEHGKRSIRARWRRFWAWRESGCCGG
jgi:DNA-directed RNA polymerase specialized sigma24 family protein